MPSVCCFPCQYGHATKSKWGILSTIQTSRIVDMHSVYLVAKEFTGCFKGKFWFSVLLLFYLDAIYLPVLKSLVHIYEM